MENNFDLLRWLFAGTVCLVHAAELSAFPQLAWISGLLSSTVAVRAFFVVSGFLIFMSYERSSSLRSYASKRLRRIYPAYAVVILLCAFVLALVSTRAPGDYFSWGWMKYVAANLVFLNFLQPMLPGVFESNTLAAVNGALWTLKIEVMFYGAVPLFVMLFRWLSPLPVLVFFYLLSVTYAELMTALAARGEGGFYEELARQLPGQLCYFMAGAYFYYFLPLFERWRGWFLAAAVAVLCVDHYYRLPLFEPFALAAVVLFFALFPYVGRFGKYGDFSYGIYILHFPIIQLLVYSGAFRDRPWVFLALALCLTMAGAVALWFGVEKRFLHRGRHAVAATAAATGIAQPSRA